LTVSPEQERGTDALEETQVRPDKKSSQEQAGNGPQGAPQEGGSAPAAASSTESPGGSDRANLAALSDADYVDPQFTYSEHVSRPLPPYGGLIAPPGAGSFDRPAGLAAPPAMANPPGPGSDAVAPWHAAPPGYPGYPGYPPYPFGLYRGEGPPGYLGYPGYPGYPAPVYPGYPGYMGPWPWSPPPPPQKQVDNYRLALTIVAMVSSMLTLFAGLLCALVLGLISLLGSNLSANLSPQQLYAAEVQLAVYALCGLIGGGFCSYHSIRALINKPSRVLRLPPFWIFLGLYIVTLTIGLILQAQGQAVSDLPLTTALIFMTAIFPALTLLALGISLLRKVRWSTSWRRFTLVLTSGATLGILLAAIFELVAAMLFTGLSGFTNLEVCISNPSDPTCQGPQIALQLFLLAAVIAPLVEETVKPLGVAILARRLGSAVEAFVLGFSAGIGFSVVETISYTSAGYQDWAHVALVRTGAGLLHGLGAGMVALGWYYLVRAKQKRFRLGLACWLYAVLQHALWNSVAGITLLPAPVGTTLQSWNISLGFMQLGADELFVLGLTLIFLVIYVLILRHLRAQQEPLPALDGRGSKPFDNRASFEGSG
jgi:RsiW-degrading membrane proteinase PrsW (M82 family)